MAKDSTVNSAAGKVNQSINNASNTASEAIQDMSDAVVGALNNLGEGLKLTPKEEPKKKDDRENKWENLKQNLDGLRVFAPELADVVDLLIGINTQFTDYAVSSAENLADSSKENEEEKEVSFDVSSKETSALNGLTNIADITGTGFSIVGNILHDMAELLASVLTGLTSDDLKGALVSANAGATLDSKGQDAEKGDQSKESKGVLASFFQGLTGPLESVASGMLLLSVAMAILSAIQLDSQLLITVILLQTFMVYTFGALAEIQKAYLENQELIDTEGKETGSVTHIIKAFATMVATVAATLTACIFIVEFLKESWAKVLTGLLIIFGTAFVTLVGLTALASSIGDMTKEEAPIAQMIKDFTTLVWTITGMAVLCSLLYPIILNGLGVASLIVTVTFLTIFGLVALISELNTTPEQLQSFNNLLKSLVVIVSVLAVITIVLGIIPESIVVQGLITVASLVLLVDTMLYMLTSAIKGMENVAEDKIKALIGILITTTVLITILGVLIYALGSMDLAAVIQGLVAVVLIAAIPIVLLKVMSKIAQNSAQLPQALLGAAIAGIITIAVAGVAWVIISMMQQFTPVQVLTTMLAVSLTTVMLIGVGLAAMALAAMATPLVSAAPLALLGIAVAGTFTLAIAGIAVLISTLLNEERARAALTAASAIILTTTALLVVSAGAIVLAALAIPLTLATGLALLAVRVLRNFLIKFSVEVGFMMEAVTQNLANVSVENMSTAFEVILQVTNSLASLFEPLLAFNLVAWGLVLNLTFATTALLVLNAEFLMFAAGISLLQFTLAVIPATDNLNLEPVIMAIEGLNRVSATLQNFKTPSIGSMLGATFTLSFVLGFAKRLGSIATDSRIDKVNNLAESLAKLASQADPLYNLADSMKLVADATKELSNVSVDSKISIEALSGKLESPATDMTKLQAPASSEESTGLKNISEQVQEAIELLRNLTESITNIRASTADIADNQTKVAQRASNVYLS